MKEQTREYKITQVRLRRADRLRERLIKFRADLNHVIRDLNKLNKEKAKRRPKKGEDKCL